MNRRHAFPLMISLLIAMQTAFAQTAKVDKGLNDANSTLSNTTNTVDNAKKTWENFFGGKKAKGASEAMIIIPGIEYEDENLDKLMDAIKDQKKDVKSATKDYNEGVVTITVDLKAKGTTGFWDELPKDLRGIFKMKSKKENSLVIGYKFAKKELLPANSLPPSSNEEKNAEATDTNSGNNPGLTDNDRNLSTTPASQEQKKNKSVSVSPESNPKGSTRSSGATTTRTGNTNTGSGQKPVTASATETKKQTNAADEKQTATLPGTGTAGAIDLSFGHPSKNVTDSLRFDGVVNAIIQQSDGKMIMGGGFRKYNEFSSNGIVRLNADGTLDKSFAIATGFDGEVNSLALQANGKVIVTGSFSNFNGQGNPRAKIARLNADGSLDNSFNVGTGFRGEVFQVLLQQDGKMLVCGNISQYNNVPCGGLVRLNNDGSLDNSFLYVKGLNGDVFSIGLLPGGKIMAGGYFNRFDKTTVGCIARLNSDGSLDASFAPGAGFSGGKVFALLPLSNGKILVGGDFNTYNKVVCHNLARLNSDGSLDNSFTQGTPPSKDYSGRGIFCLVQQSDGKILAGGRFEEYNGSSSSGVMRIEANGAIDKSFTPPTAGFDNKGVGAALVHAIVLRPDGWIVTGGSFRRYDMVQRNNIASLDKNGKLQQAFAISTGFNRIVNTLALQKDGKIIVGGNFETFDGIAQNGLTRLQANGAHDPSFQVFKALDNAAIVNTVAVQEDGRVIVGGTFRNYAGIARSCVTRVNADGSLDNDFYVGTGFDNPVLCSAVQPDGKVLLGGRFRQYDGVAAPAIVRLNKDGRMDNSFQPGDGYANGVFLVRTQPDGKVLIAGALFMVNGQRSSDNALARLNANGNPDNGFRVDPGVRSFRISDILVQPDGKVLLAGRLSIAGGELGNRMVRLNSDGSLDKTFSSDVAFTGLHADRFNAALQPDGKIIVFGDFTQSTKAAVKKMARLNKDGTLDLSFITGQSFEGSDVVTAALQPDGRLIVAGDFQKYDGYTATRIVRLNTKNEAKKP